MNGYSTSLNRLGSVLSGPNNADPAKLPRRVVKRPVIGGGAALLLLSDFYVKVRSRGCLQRQSATTDRSCTYLSDDERGERRRPGNFTAEVPHKVLNDSADARPRIAPSRGLR